MRISKKVRRRIQLKQRKQATARKQIHRPPDKADLRKAEAQQSSQVADNEKWVEQNFSGCNFGHVLRTQRLMIMANNMLECPNESLGVRLLSLKTYKKLHGRIEGMKLLMS